MQLSATMVGFTHHDDAFSPDDYNHRDDEGYGFQKHGCLQYSIGSEGFSINLFFSSQAWSY